MRLLLLLLFCFNLWANDPSVTLSSKVDRAQLASGETLTYMVTLEMKEEMTLELPELGDNIQGFRVVEFGIDDPIVEDGRRTTSRWYKLQADLAGSYILPGMTLKYKDVDGSEEEVKTSEIFIEVVSNFKKGDESDKRMLVDIKGLQKSERKLTVWGWVLVATILIIIGVLILIWFRTKNEKLKPVDLPKPHQVALLEFEQLERQNLLEKGEFKRFFFTFNETLKKYYESFSKIAVTDMTLEEILRSCSERKVRELDSFLDIMKRSELVKFADKIPTIEEGERLLEQARNIVNDTKPSEVEFHDEESVI